MKKDLEAAEDELDIANEKLKQVEDELAATRE